MNLTFRMLVNIHFQKLTVKNLGSYLYYISGVWNLDRKTSAIFKRALKCFVFRSWSLFPK